MMRHQAEEATLAAPPTATLAPPDLLALMTMLMVGGGACDCLLSLLEAVLVRSVVVVQSYPVCSLYGKVEMVSLIDSFPSPP